MPDEARIADIAEAFGVTVADLLEPQPETFELDQLVLAGFGQDAWMPSMDSGVLEKAGINPTKTQSGLWRIPASALLPHSSSEPKLAVFRATGNAMAPELSDGDHAIIDLNWRVMYPSGLYLISRPLHFALKRCEMLSGEKAGRVRVRDVAQNGFDDEFDIDELEVVGRIILKLRPC
jgi:hypothetical protein